MDENAAASRNVNEMQLSQQLSDVDTRQLRNDVINVVLSKLNSQTNVANDEILKSSFDYIACCVLDLPWLLVTVNKVDDANNGQTLADSTALIRWLIIQLFEAVATLESDTLQLLAPKALISIFNLARTNNLATFKIITNDLIELATVVCQADAEFVAGNCSDCEIYFLPKGLGGLYDEISLNLEVNPLEIRGMKGVNRLLHLIMFVTSEVMSGLILHNPKVIPSIWILLGHVINTSLLHLKKEALKCLNLLLKSDVYLDSPYVFQYVMSVLLSFVEHFYLTLNVEVASELQDVEVHLNSILSKLVFQKTFDFDYQECAITLCKVYSKINSLATREVFGAIIIKLIIDDVHLGTLWNTILPSKSENCNDVEWLSVAKCYVIKSEMKIYGLNSWNCCPTWKTFLKQYREHCERTNNNEFLFERLFLICDILAIILVIAKNGLYNSECYSVMESAYQSWLATISTYSPNSALDTSKFYELVLCYSSLLFKLQDWVPLSKEHSVTLTALLSLPWLHSASTTLDLSCRKLLSNDPLVLAAKEHLSEADKSRALVLLAMLPSEIAVKWRICIITKELISKVTMMASAAVRSLAWFFHMLDVQDFSLFEKYLTGIVDGEAHVLNCSELVPVFLQLTCALYGGACIKWCAEGSKQFTIESKLVCSGLSTLPQNKRIVTCCEIVWRSLFSHRDPIVRRDVARNLPHLILHFGGNNRLFELCLPYLEDTSSDVRFAFSCSTQFFDSYFSSSTGANFQSVFLNRVESIYGLAKGRGDVSQMETLNIAIATLAKIAVKDLFQFAIIFLLENVHSSNTCVRTTATLQLREVAAFKKLSPKQLFINCSCAVSKFLCKLLYKAQERGDARPLDAIETTVIAFQLNNSNDILKQLAPYLLPRILESMTDSTSDLVHLIANQLNISPRAMIFNEFRHIFCHLVCSSSSEVMNKVLTYIVTETEASVDDILLNHSQAIYNELMLHLASNRDVAISALRNLPSRGQKSSALKSTQMFLGFLACFDSYIYNCDVGVESKQLAVESLVEAIKLMGSKNLSTVYMKAMATLRTLLRISDSSIIPLCCNAWLAFIQTLDPVVVGSTLNQIVVALLPLVNTCVQGITKILEYIIIEKRSDFEDYFCDLYCIPDVDEFSHLLSIVKEYLGNPKSKQQLKQILQPIINGVVHENIDVRTRTLAYLNDLIVQHGKLFESLIMEEDSVDVSVSQLIDKLMMSCKDNDSISQKLIGKCLGKLGAIDPSRLVIESPHSLANGSQIKVYLTIEDDSFVHDLLTTLTKAFLGASENYVQNSASYALQEILQLYEISNSPGMSGTRGGRLWNSLPENVKDNLELLFHSKFVCQENLNYNELFCRPIYNSQFGSTFPKWLSNWTEYLISEVNQPKARKLFWVCRKIVRHDIKVALFLLPSVLIYVIQENNLQFVDEVIQEISLVLKHSVETKIHLETDLQRMSVQVVFTLIDHLNNWILLKKKAKSISHRRNQQNSPDDHIFHQDHVSPFLEQIPKYLLAEAAFHAQTYARALMNLEAHVRSNANSLDEHLGFFLKLYKALDEPDGVAGITDVSKRSTLRDQIISHENSGRHQDALLCYQRAIVAHPEELQYCEGYLRCLMDLDFPQTALVYCAGVLAQNPTWIKPIKSYQVEAAWKLASWNVLDSYLTSDEPLNPTWGYRIGKILSTVGHRDKSMYLKELEICRGAEILPLSAASLESGSYERVYEHLLRFHMLEEIDQTVETFIVFGDDDNCVEKVNRLIQQWQFRQQFIRTSKKCLEPILNLRRVLLGMAADHLGPNLSSTMELEICRLWLQSAKISRRCGQLQPDYSCILSTFLHVLPEVGPEQAKWHWLKGEKEQAMLCLSTTINEIYPTFTSVTSNLRAKAKLLLARYSEESGNLESSAIIQMFRDVLVINPEREDSHYYLARYYDRILTAAGRIDKRSDMVPLVIKHFGLSLKCGCRYVHLSMPRMLSLWLEFGSLVIETDRNNPRTTEVTNTLRKTLAVINSKLINEFTATLPSYLFYTAFSQLISRICHSHSDVFSNLKEIIAKLIVDYPQQSIWLMTAVSKSSYAIRAQRCHEIFHRAIKLSSQLAIFQTDVNKLTDLLVQLCNMPVDAGSNQLKVSTHCKGLKQLLQNTRFSRVILPCQRSLNVTLPSIQQSNSPTASYNPFPESLVYIHSIEERIDVMASLQKPKKITIRGSDGQLYSIMCKPKDDLRKDSRLMEFNLMVNKFLLKDPESRRRHLHIRTYSVVPLNEECGLIEWVPNLHAMRLILHEIYREKNILVTNATLKSLAPQRHDTSTRKLDIFRNKLLPLYPPVLSEWFLKMFPNPTAWYFARSSYSRTSAVMSIVGYILGLGDRHGENILLDSSCGDTVHVDFNCLFNKGESFDWPELVPFRLTHNMVDAMGPLGYQGVFRKSSETTLKVMRKQMETLMSFLKPFIYDPLVEWSRPARNQANISRAGISGEQGEITNEMAKVHVQDIELRLLGVVKNKSVGMQGKGIQNPFPLSVEGQASILIKQATDQMNLSHMYIGWAAYM